MSLFHLARVFINHNLIICHSKECSLRMLFQKNHLRFLTTIELIQLLFVLAALAFNRSRFTWSSGENPTPSLLLKNLT